MQSDAFAKDHGLGVSTYEVKLGAVMGFISCNGQDKQRETDKY